MPIHCKRPVKLLALGLLCGIVPKVIAVTVTGSPHDLSASAGGDACAFCHTPHVTSRSVLWDQTLSPTVYKIYASSSLDAVVGQPTGSSKMCLSCHDGTVASGFTGTLRPGGAFVGPGEANLGTDLSDDHPISFAYTDALVAKDPQLRPASTLPETLKLDGDNELQCTTCHDAHDNQFGDFLTMSNQRSRMCVSCHTMQGWSVSSHRHDSASVMGSHNRLLADGPHQTVGDLACMACHKVHSAGGPERLLHFEQSEETCFSCHDGTVGTSDIKAELIKPSRHDVVAFRNNHDLRESPLAMSRHVECSDCHNPHAVQKQDAQAPLIQGAMRHVTGITSSGGVTPQARFEYEVCFKCHADNPSRIGSDITRVVTQTNTRLEFDPSAHSFHPVVGPGVSKNVPSLRAGLSVASVIYCTDCHSSEEGSATRGPHGSIYRPLLKHHYETSDFTSESEFAYALCYSCHSRNSILSDESFPTHRLHLDQRIPCSACHDAHGVSSAQGSRNNHTHLINFDTSIVSRDPGTDRLEFVDMGVFQGMCYMSCHGTQHSGQVY